jgi:hypothetical protein
MSLLHISKFGFKCEAIIENFISGTLCMDACIYKKVKLDSCLTTHPESNYRVNSLN